MPHKKDTYSSARIEDLCKRIEKAENLLVKKREKAQNLLVDCKNEKDFINKAQKMIPIDKKSITEKIFKAGESRYCVTREAAPDETPPKFKKSQDKYLVSYENLPDRDDRYKYSLYKIDKDGIGKLIKDIYQTETTPEAETIESKDAYQTETTPKAEKRDNNDFCRF